MRGGGWGLGVWGAKSGVQWGADQNASTIQPLKARFTVEVCTEAGGGGEDSACYLPTPPQPKMPPNYLIAPKGKRRQTNST